MDYDVIVIGTGPGGEGAAMKAVKDGAKVAVVERDPHVGGACTHKGTIPSKALRQAVQSLMEFRSNPLFTELAYDVDVSFPQLLRTAESVIQKQVHVRQSFYDRNRVKVHRGHARFVDKHTIEVELPQGGFDRLTARHFILATGSRPYRPPDVDFSNPLVFDSDTILDLQYTPQTVTIYGAGVIGCEYASIFRNLGVKINLINTRAQLLSFLDAEITDALSYHLRDQGVLIRNNEEFASLCSDERGVVLELKSGKRIRSDILLWANGRTGNTDDLGLENVGLKANSRGQLSVDADYRTAQSHVYAVGDVIGFPSLASAAYDQGRFAASHMTQGECEASLVENVPTGIYTTPEISCIGKTETELTEERVPYEVGHALFRHLARAQITGQTVGMLKLLFHRETMQVLGIHCFGHQASEILHIGQAIMAQDGPANTVWYFVHNTFNYPTMAEAYRVAALNGLNRVAHSVKPPGLETRELSARTEASLAPQSDAKADVDAASEPA